MFFFLFYFIYLFIFNFINLLLSTIPLLFPQGDPLLFKGLVGLVILFYSFGNIHSDVKWHCYIVDARNRPKSTFHLHNLITNGVSDQQCYCTCTDTVGTVENVCAWESGCPKPFWLLQLQFGPIISGKCRCLTTASFDKGLVHKWQSSSKGVYQAHGSGGGLLLPLVLFHSTFACQRGYRNC